MAHMHAGHRARLKQRFMNEGLEHFQPHEVIELLLFATIPQRDVNPLAHRLIDRFGSVGGVLSAPVEDLVLVDGVGLRTAEWIATVNRASAHYVSLSLNDRPQLSTLNDVSDYVTDLFMQSTQEQTWIFSLNLAGHLIHSAQLSDGRPMDVKSLTRRIADLAIRYHAYCFVLAQRRSPANMRIEPRDVELTQAVCDTLFGINIPMIDHVFVCGHRVKSLRREGIIYRESAPLLNERANLSLFDHWLDETET